MNIQRKNIRLSNHRKRKYRFVFIAVLCISVNVAAQTIVNSKHDLSAGNTGATQWQSVNESQICIFCHTPHRVISSVQPLWNKSLPSNTTFSVYSSPSMDATPNSDLAGSYSLLCLSCHDGVTAMNTLANMSNIGTPLMAGGYSKLGEVYYPGSIFGEFPGMNIGEGYNGITNNNLSNDHPVGFEYAASHSDVVKGKLKNPDVQQSGLGGTIAEKMLFNQKMECPSCHNPHDPTRAPFLKKSNVNSNLCITCHNK